MLAPSAAHGKPSVGALSVQSCSTEQHNGTHVPDSERLCTYLV